ncbi:arabinogalactan protein 20-like [Hibiscus syriacus]|uniref:arabinogalactan protein 20-like n=1 Tax=Hibiscus syriacus TaxID=106335 RepID=UPI001924E6B1|nr:arabinogalactan protein 20-like [Hibiscus syriacus]
MQTSPFPFICFQLYIGNSFTERDLFRICWCKSKNKMTTISSPTFMGGALVFAIMAPYVGAQSASPAPSRTSDGTSIERGIAYVLMLLALVLTYLIHPLDATFF